MLILCFLKLKKVLKKITNKNMASGRTEGIRSSSEKKAVLILVS